MCSGVTMGRVVSAKGGDEYTPAIKNVICDDCLNEMQNSLKQERFSRLD